MLKIIFLTILALFIIFLICGCGVSVSKEVVYLAIDTSNVQTETSDALIKNIDEDMQKKGRTEAEIVALRNLRDRLDYLKRANRALFLSMTTKMSPKDLAALLKEGDNYKGEIK